MKKLAFIAITLLASHVGFAQHGKQKNAGVKKEDMSVDEQAKNESQRVSQKLSLTKDQEIKWENAARERIMANEPLRTKMNGSTTPEERKQLKNDMRTNMEDFDKKTESFLTPEQKTKYENLKKERRNKHHGHKKDHNKDHSKAPVTD